MKQMYTLYVDNGGSLAMPCTALINSDAFTSHHEFWDIETESIAETRITFFHVFGFIMHF